MLGRHRVDGRVGGEIEALLALPLRAHDARRAQKPQVMADERRRQTQRPSDRADRQPPFGTGEHDAQTRRIAEQPEQVGKRHDAVVAGLRGHGCRHWKTRRHTYEQLFICYRSTRPGSIRSAPYRVWENAASVSPNRLPTVMEPVFARAWTAHRDGRLDDAERDYLATLAADPVHVDALHLLGVLRHQQGQHAAAVDLVRRAADLRPDDAALQLNLGNALKALGQLDGAIERFRNALSLAPTFPMAHYNLGNAYAAAGRHEDAADAFRKSLHLQPADASSHNNLGNALHALGRHRDAIAAFERALELRPGHAGAHNNLGMALNALNRADEAIVRFKAALAVEPRFVAAQFNLANTLDALGRHEEAVAAFETALRLQPHLAPALFGLGNALAALGRHAEATQHFERAVGLDPAFALAWLSLGTARQALGEHEAALRAFDQALRLRPDLASAHMNRALVWLTLGDFKRGLPEYEWRLETVTQPGAQTLPRWRGEPIEGRTLFLHAEQGFGDTLRFVRFLPLVARHAVPV